MTFNKFWVLLVFALLYFLFFQNCIMYNCTMENCIYYIVGAIQSDDLVQVFFLHYCGRYYRVNSLNTAINSIPKYGNMSETTRCPNP